MRCLTSLYKNKQGIDDMLSREESERVQISEVIYLCYDLLVSISENRILATHGNNISLIDTNGEMICTYDMIIVPTMEDNSFIFETDDHVFETQALYVDDYLIVIHAGKQGLIDYDGNVIIDTIYSEIKFNTNGSIEVLP